MPWKIRKTEELFQIGEIYMTIKPMWDPELDFETDSSRKNGYLS